MKLYSISNEKSRQLTTFNLETKKKTLRVPPKETVVVATCKGPGIISRIWFTFTGWFYEHWNPTAEVDPTILKKLILRIYWDNSPTPSVEAPLGDFFGIGHCEYKSYLSKYIGMSSGGFYCLFPMPFEQVKITIENLHDSINPHIFMNVNYNLVDKLPENSGRFHCQFNTGRYEGKIPIKILESQGKGHYAGCSLSLQGQDKNYLSFLEAPEYFFIDGEKKASIVGTGLEDYIGGGWYFREDEFNAPLHGVPLKDALRSMVTMYRFHDEDRINFQKSLLAQFDNPWKGEVLQPYWYSSTAYYYLNGIEKVKHPFCEDEQLLGMYRIRDRDHQSIP